MSLLNRMKKAARAVRRIMTAPTLEAMAAAEASAMRVRTLRKATNMVAQTSKRYYMTEADEVEALDQRAKQLMDDPQRKAIYSVNSYLNIFGIPRPNFWKADNDRLARNAIYAVCEKRIMDTIETAEWEVVDGTKKVVEPAETFLKKPNPQDTFQTLIKQTIPDILRYDQAVWVKTKAIAGNLLEVKVYSGPEFWIEVDNKFDQVQGQFGLSYYGPWSHGYVKRYWQHSRPGVYIPFAPEDICMIMMYKRADSIYGTDFIQQLKWQLEYMIDSTKAAGMTFANGIGPSLIWKHPDLSSIEQLEERNMEVELENKGPENFGNILHLLGQEEISTVFPELMHMQWLEGQQFISSIIWAMFGFSASEFTSSDVNRATAYINQNITKSKMLAPILKHIETVINTEILPELDGYQPDWKFAFKPIVELDDKLKEVQVSQGQADAVSKWINNGVPLEEAMRMVGVDEEHIETVTAAVDQVSQQQNQSMDAALQNLKQADISGELAEDAAGEDNQPDQGGKPHVEGYSGQAQSDSGKPEDSGQPGKKPPFTKSDFKEADHPRADDGQFGDKPGDHKTAPSSKENNAASSEEAPTLISVISDKNAGKAHADKVEASLNEAMWTFGAGAIPGSVDLMNYLGDGYTEVNNYLRNERQDPKLSIHKSTERISRIISQAPLIGKGTELFRGVGIRSGEVLAAAEVGSTCNDKAFQSYSLNPAVAADFANVWEKDGKRHTTVIKAVTDGNQHAIYTNEHKPPEYEMLLDKGTSWRVSGNKTYEQGGLVYHIVEVIPNA